MTGMQQRNVRAVLALGCAVALLLPILSSFDDDFLDGKDFLAAEVVAAVVLIALALVHPQQRSLARVTLTTLADPRSPPRA